MLPLTGYRVLACENGLAGPLCSRLLADFGADVVKIERPEGGDVTRGWDTGAKGLSSGFVWVNRGKRSVALEWKERYSSRTVECSATISGWLAQAVASVGCEPFRLTSGAGHDAVSMSRLTEVGMLFVRCRKGISHCSAESVAAQDVELAVEALDRFLSLVSGDLRSGRARA